MLELAEKESETANCRQYLRNHEWVHRQGIQQEMKTILKDLINNKVLLYNTGNLKPIMEKNMKKNLYVGVCVCVCVCVCITLL